METSKLCELCEGCSLCVAVCGVNAIKMRQDDRGFYFAQIDEEKCVNCRLCEKVCQEKRSQGRLPLEIWAAKTKSQEILMGSSSGGLFTEISNYVLKQGGVVYGATFDEEFRVVHQRATTKEKRDCMRGSKYVQSDLDDIFLKVYEDLLFDEMVLFTGTPCQVDAISTFLRIKKVNTDKFVSCEVICNGVSSSGLWKRYVEEYMGLDKIKNVSFRFKHKKIQGSIFAIEKKSGIIDISGYYSQLYTGKNCMSPACYECKYAQKERYADISIGDLQGEITSPITFDKNNGASVVLLNTEKGIEVWKAIDTHLYADNLGHGYSQKRLTSPCKKPKTYEQFWKDYKELSIRKLLKKYTNKSFVEDLRCVRNGRKLNKK